MNICTLLESARTTLNRCVSEEQDHELRCMCAAVVGDIEKAVEEIDEVYCIQEKRYNDWELFLASSENMWELDLYRCQRAEPDKCFRAVKMMVFKGVVELNPYAKD